MVAGSAPVPPVWPFSSLLATMEPVTFGKQTWFCYSCVEPFCASRGPQACWANSAAQSGDLTILVLHPLLPVPSVSPTVEPYALFPLTVLRDLNILASLPTSPCHLAGSYSFLQERVLRRGFSLHRAALPDSRPFLTIYLVNCFSHPHTSMKHLTQGEGYFSVFPEVP